MPGSYLATPSPNPVCTGWVDPPLTVEDVDNLSRPALEAIEGNHVFGVRLNCWPDRPDLPTPPPRRPFFRSEGVAVPPSPLPARLQAPEPPAPVLTPIAATPEPLPAVPARMRFLRELVP